MKAAIIALVILSLGLAGGLLWRHTKARSDEHLHVADKIFLTNQLNETKGKLDENEQMASFLQKNLDQANQKLSDRSNEVLRLSGTLAKTQQDAQFDEPTYLDQRYLGWEPDFFMNWQITNDVTFAVRYGIFYPGHALVNDEKNRQFFFAGVTYAF